MVDGKPARPETRIQQDAVIQIVTQKEMEKRTSPSKENRTFDVPLPDILANGAGIIVFNKPAGLASHGPKSLDTLVKAHYTNTSLSFRSGPLHRLDRPTSGAIAFSENLAGARLFSELLRERRIAKTYLAIVEGLINTSPHEELLWHDMLLRDKIAKKTFVATAKNAGGSIATEKTAETMIRVIASCDRYSFIEAKIATGRTHQIRAQAAAHGYPLAGDIKYGGRAILSAKPYISSFFLHAWKIEFDRDIDGLPRLICAPPPEPFLAQVHSIFGDTPTMQISKILP